VLDRDGFPRHERGVTEVAGLYVIGLPWLYTWGSGRFSGVGRDATHIAEHLTALLRGTRTPAPERELLASS
jgi:putative flavoprotein involved in K+ transport